MENREYGVLYLYAHVHVFIYLCTIFMIIIDYHFMIMMLSKVGHLQVTISVFMAISVGSLFCMSYRGIIDN